MALVEIGRVCVKKLGRDAGSRAVITRVIDQRFVGIVTATRLRERKCNVSHLEFLSEKVDTGSREQLAKALGVDVAKLEAKK